MVSLFTVIVGLAIQWALGYARWLYEAAPKAFLVADASSTLVPFVLAPVVAIVGAFRLSGGLGHSNLLSFILACIMVVPGINLVVMVWLAVRANAALSAAGHRVGVFGLRDL